ncbi:MAG: discoidin domain-containing protein, partial [Cetobacterium sp.]
MQNNLKNMNNLVFTIETNIKNVMNRLEVSTASNILNANIDYVDEYGYEKVAQLVNIEKEENRTILTFDYFYTDSFNLTLSGDFVEESIEGVKIVPLNQNEFYEDKDIDVRVDKSTLTAETLCGRYSNNYPSYAIDGDEATGFHSANYTGYAPGTYGDFVISSEKPFLVDRLLLRSRGSGNGRIKAYQILYRTTKTEEWKKVFEQLTEQSGINREAVFKPVLATDICIRVTNGHGNFVMIAELDLFKYNYIEKRIADLFVDEAQTVIKPETTIEEIETLQSEVKTESYISRLDRAKELCISAMPKSYFEIPLNGEK